VPTAVIPALLAAWRKTDKEIVAPVYRGTQGTPVLFGAEVFAELSRLTGDAGARAVVAARPERVELVSFDIPMPPDVDTPEDYARLHVQ
jgi:molybdenum cofactor cytidylyltransferase